MPHVVAFDDPAADRVDLVGGKAAGLRSLLGLRLPVPPGFVVATTVYREFVGAAAGKLENLLAGAGTPEGDREASRAVEALQLSFDR